MDLKLARSCNIREDYLRDGICLPGSEVGSFAKNQFNSRGNFSKFLQGHAIAKAAGNFNETTGYGSVDFTYLSATVVGLCLVVVDCGVHGLRANCPITLACKKLLAQGLPVSTLLALACVGVRRLTQIFTYAASACWAGSPQSYVRFKSERLL